MKKLSCTLLISSLLTIFASADGKIDLQKLLNEKNISAIEAVLAQEPQNGEAHYIASLYYSTNGDADQSGDKKVQYLQESADLGWAEAQMQYGFYLLNNGEGEKGLVYIEKAAEQDYVQALTMMGDLYFAGYRDKAGKDVVLSDLDKSIGYLERAVDEGDQDARYTLGHIYLDDDLGRQDIDKALALFEANIDYANKRGHLSTLISLINLYTEGKKVQPSTEKLLDYFYLASLQDYIPAAYTVGIAQKKGQQGARITVAKDMEAAFINLQKVATAGYVDAMFQISEMYFKGEGVGQSDSYAYVWLAIAEDLTGNQSAYSDKLLELIPKKQRQATIDTKNQLKQFFNASSKSEEL